MTTALAALLHPLIIVVDATSGLRIAECLGIPAPSKENVMWLSIGRVKV
jgi:hypothetical protein